PLVSGHKPSVDYLFQSVSEVRDCSWMAIMLTGMGGDGSLSMKRLHDQGALTVAQDEATCVVFGMPREAIRVGAVSHILPLDEIPKKIIQYGSDKSESLGAA
ncbi:MAG: chemotaxis protein CheB, partial [Planctomycetes bacterium]|nr:chemotaxis protein CheB [Planctomycetota bacterium]